MTENSCFKSPMQRDFVLIDWLFNLLLKIPPQIFYAFLVPEQIK